MDERLEEITPLSFTEELPSSTDNNNATVEPLMLRTENLVKKYGKRTVVNHVSINVKQGEIVGLLGPNGAGKTTTFYMTVGLIVPNEGVYFYRRPEHHRFSGL